MKHKTGGDFNTGGFLSEPGTYHFCITDATESPTNKSGALIDNAAFRVTVEALGGTAAGQENKCCDLLFFHPKPTDKNEGAFARKKIDRFLLAVGLVGDDDKDREVDIDLAKCVGRQFVAKMEADEDNARFLRVAFADIYHVDDPAVKAVPKNEAALKLIPASLRKIGSQPVKPAASKSNGAAAKSADKKPVPATEQWTDL